MNYDDAITMPTQLALLLLFLSSSTTGSTQGPGSYIESGAPIVIRSNASLPIEITCYHALSEIDPEVTTGARSPRSTVKHGDQWSINFPPGVEDPLYCTFRSGLRKWNCDERWLVKDACVWENSWTIVRPGHATINTQSNPDCPRCESRNSIGKIICVWTIQDDGIYVQEWNAEKKEDVPTLKHAWREDSPAFYDPTSPFRFSVANTFNHTVKIQCDVVSEAIFLEASPGEGQNLKWEYEIDPVMDAETIYFPWTCDFEVLGTELRRGGVGIWSPQPEVNTWIRTPDCIDCAWRLDTAGLWLDDRSCYIDQPVWIREHGWDSILNASAAGDMDWNPFYYPLKKSSHSHFV